MFAKLLQLARESAIYGLSSVLRSFIAVFLVPIYTRIFTPADYGVISMVTTITLFLGVFIGLGAEASFAVSYYDTEDEQRRAELVFNYVLMQFVTGLLVATGLFVASEPLAATLLGSAERALYLQIAALTIAAGLLNPVLSNLFRIARKPWTLVALTTAMTIAQVALSMLFIIGLQLGLLGNFLAQLIVAVIFLFISLILIRPHIAATRPALTAISPMLRLGLPYVVTGFSLQLITLADRLFLEHFRSLEEVGLYAIGVSLASVLGLATGAFQMALGPYAMSIQRDPDARQTYSSILTTFFALAAGCAVGLSVFAREILLIMTTPAYVPASQVVPYLAFYVIAVGIGYIASLGTWLAKKTGNLAWTTFVGAIANIILNMLLIPPLGIVGAAIATLGAQSVYVGLLFWASQRCYPIPYRWRDLAQISAISAALIILGLGAEALPILSALLIKVALVCLFPVCLVLTRIVEPAAAWKMMSRLRLRQG